MKKISKALSLILCISIVISTLAFCGAFVSAEEPTYSVGDIIEFGSYPQTDVTGELGNVLNEIEGTWKSYGYYVGTNTTESTETGTMRPSNFMRYKDITYNGNEYRGVYFDSYRPFNTYFTFIDFYNFQEENGYFTKSIYWFKYEPIKWRVLDPETGFIMCDSIIDSQPFNNYVLQEGENYWGNSEKTYYANDYSNSSIRQWLNNDFYNAAFSNQEKTNILLSSNSNKCYKTIVNGNGKYDSADTQDWVSLLAFDESTNNQYGFCAESDYDLARRIKGSAYSKCQGLNVFNSDDNFNSQFNGCSNWCLRTAGTSSQSICTFTQNGSLSTRSMANYALYGIVPAIRVENLNYGNEGQNVNIQDYKATFVVNGITIKEALYKEGETITIPVNPSIEGYTFKGWSPSIPSTMPANNLTFTAMFEKINPTTNAIITVKSSATIDYRAGIMLTATATGVPDGYVLAVYEGNTLKAKGTNKEVTYAPKDSNGKPIQFKANTTLTVKIIDKNNVVQKDSSGKELTAKCEITVKQGFFDKLIAFFKGLFGSLPIVKI